MVVQLLEEASSHVLQYRYNPYMLFDLQPSCGASSVLTVYTKLALRLLADKVPNYVRSTTALAARAKRARDTLHSSRDTVLKAGATILQKPRPAFKSCPQGSQVCYVPFEQPLSIICMYDKCATVILACSGRSKQRPWRAPTYLVHDVLLGWESYMCGTLLHLGL